jgi:hypothetical protein
VALQPDVVSIMPPSELEGDDPVIHPIDRRSVLKVEVMDREHDRNPPAPGDFDHPDGDRIAAIGEQQIRLKNIEEDPEKRQDGLDLLGPRSHIPGGIQPHDGVRHIAPAGVQNAGVRLPRWKPTTEARTKVPN